MFWGPGDYDLLDPEGRHRVVYNQTTFHFYPYFRFRLIFTCQSYSPFNMIDVHLIMNPKSLEAISPGRRDVAGDGHSWVSPRNGLLTIKFLKTSGIVHKHDTDVK